MLIAIPVEEKVTEASICPSFGRTPYFLVHDTETKVDVDCNAGRAIKDVFKSTMSLLNF